MSYGDGDDGGKCEIYTGMSSAAITFPKTSWDSQDTWVYPVSLVRLTDSSIDTHNRIPGFIPLDISSEAD